MLEPVDEWPAPSESNEPAYSSFSSEPNEGNSRYSSYRTGGQWNSDTFLSDSPPGRSFCSNLIPEHTHHKEPAADSSEATTRDGVDPSSSSGAGKKRSPPLPADGSKRVKIDYTLESGEQIDVMEASLHRMKKVAGKPGAKPMWFCMLCFSDLTGQNIELHFRSPEHVKKVINSNTLESESKKYPFYCELCMIGCNNQHIYVQHMSGKKHKKFQNASARIRSLPDSPDDAVEELREMLKETVLEEGKASTLGVSEDMKEFYTLKEPLIGLQYAVEIRGLTCDSPIYHCMLCNVHVISGNKGKHFCSNNHRQLVLQKEYPEKWEKVKAISVKTEQHKLLSEIAAEIEAAEGKKVEDIFRRIVKKPSWNEPVDTNKLEKKAKHGRGKRRGGGGGGQGGAGSSRQSGEPGASTGEKEKEGIVPQKGKRDGQRGRGRNQKKGGNQGIGRMHPQGNQRGREGSSRGGLSPRGAFGRRGGGRGKGKERWREQDERAYYQYGEFQDTGYPREEYSYQEDYYHDPYRPGLEDPYYASPPAWDRPPPPSHYPLNNHHPPPPHLAPYQDSPMDPSPTIQQLFHTVSNSTQSSEVGSMASSLVRTAEDADMALKLSSVLNQALMRYHAAPPPPPR